VAVAGWAFVLGGFTVAGMLALAHFAGRLGPGQLWFRAPSFYLAAAIVASGAAWWLARPAPPAVRFGLPAAALGVLGLAALLTRADGRSVPLAMLMPTMRATAPEIVYVDSAGARRTLSDLRGKVVLVNFWATWCTPCRREMPLLARMQREHAADGLVVVYLSLEEPAVLDAFLREHSYDGVHGRLEHADAFYDAGKFYPLSYLISREGRVENRWSGRPAEDWLASILRAQLD
jgi:thiol-disulfide isomerase/thioredoxin